MFKKLLKIILLQIVILFFPLYSFAQVSKIAFTSNTQVIKLGEMSLPITIQTQDSSANSSPTTETLDLEFTSTSPTGEFLNSSGNEASKIMSRNTSNRTFYYKDSTEGEFVITVNATGRDSGEVWEASQNITVSSSISQPVSNKEEVSGSSTQSSSSSSQSATGASVSVSYSTPTSELQVSAGGDRLTSPGSPIFLQASIKKNPSSNSSVRFNWSYGDGEVGTGALVSHTYKYPGEYAVVLNAISGNNFAVARLKVKVVAPELSVSYGDSFVEISNNSNYEINLFNWKIINNGKAFVFQPDTIVFPKSKIKIDNSLFLMKNEVEGKTIIKDSLGREVVNVSTPLSLERVMEVSEQLEEVKLKAVSLIDQAIAKGMVQELSPRILENPTMLENSKIVEGEMAGASVQDIEEKQLEDDVIYEAPKNVGILTRAWQFLVDMIR